jgi:hypothetical protein
METTRGKLNLSDLLPYLGASAGTNFFLNIERDPRWNILRKVSQFKRERLDRPIRKWQKDEVETTDEWKMGTGVVGGVNLDDLVIVSSPRFTKDSTVVLRPATIYYIGEIAGTILDPLTLHCTRIQWDYLKNYAEECLRERNPVKYHTLLGKFLAFAESYWEKKYFIYPGIIDDQKGRIEELRKSSVDLQSLEDPMKIESQKKLIEEIKGGFERFTFEPHYSGRDDKVVKEVLEEWMREHKSYFQAMLFPRVGIA